MIKKLEKRVEGVVDRKEAKDININDNVILSQNDILWVEEVKPLPNHMISIKGLDLDYKSKTVELDKFLKVLCIVKHPMIIYKVSPETFSIMVCVFDLVADDVKKNILSNGRYGAYWFLCKDNAIAKLEEYRNNNIELWREKEIIFE